MNGHEFIASIVQSIVSLAWPAAIFGAVLLFRVRLSELLPFLHVRYKDAEASFRFEQAEKEAAALPPPTVETTPTAEEKTKFEKIARISPRAAILEARTDIEEAIRTLAQQAGLLTPKVQSTLGLSRLLRRNEKINPQAAALLDDLRVIGNQAAHNREADFSYEDALRYRSLADQAIAQLTDTS
jgi:hypothetical protein